MDRLFDRLVFDDQSPVYLQIIAFVKQRWLPAICVRETAYPRGAAWPPSWASIR
jgi:hypothetical protein